MLNPLLLQFLQGQSQPPKYQPGQAQNTPNRVMDVPSMGMGQMGGGGLDVPPQANAAPAWSPERIQGHFQRLIGNRPPTMPRTAMPGYNDPLPPPDPLAPARSARDAQFAKLLELLNQAPQRQAPPPVQQPTGYRDLLPVGILSIIAHLLGAKESDIAQGIGGFMQGRQNWAQGVNQERGQQFDYDQRFQELTRQNQLTGAEMGYRKASDDYGFEVQQQQQARTENFNREKANNSERAQLVDAFNRADLESEKRLVGQQLVRLGYMMPEEVEAAIAEVKKTRDQKTWLPIMRDALKTAGDLQTPEGRTQARMTIMSMVNAGTLPKESIDELSRILADPTYANESARLSNEGKVLKNKFDEQSFDTRLNNLKLEGKIKNETWQFIKIKREKYPAYLQALMNRGMLQDARTLQEINTRFNDAKADAFDRKYGDYLGGQRKRLAVAQAEYDKWTNNHKMLSAEVARGSTQVTESDVQSAWTLKMAAKKQMEDLQADIARIEKLADPIVPFNPMLPNVNGVASDVLGAGAPGGSELSGSSFGGSATTIVPTKKEVPPKNTSKSSGGFTVLGEKGKK